MTPDTVGFVIARSPLYPALLDYITADEWRDFIRATIEADCVFVGAGRPDIQDGNGIYAMVRALDALPEAIALAHARVGESGSRVTAWMVLADDDTDGARVARDALALIMPTEGSA